MLDNLSVKNSLLYFLIPLLLICIGISIAIQSILPMLIPSIALGAYIVYFDYRIIYYFLIFSIPLSLHIEFGAAAMDVGSEPLMIILLLISPIVFLLKYKDLKFTIHPIIFLITLQLIWALYCTQFSTNSLVSYKYLISKLWYIIPFVFYSIVIINNPSKFKIIFWLYFIALEVACIYTIIGHAMQNFSFAASNFVMQPLFPNHVIYSASIATFIPFCWFARKWYNPGSLTRIIINLGFIILIAAIILSYTRASWLAVLLLVPSYYAIKNKLTKLGLLVGIICITITVCFLLNKNKYLDYSVQFEKVVYNRDDIGKHLEATYNMEDVSGMERIYRWVAAKNLILDNFWLGTGPNTFYPEYKKYTVKSFETYVSDNPERSTSHNYFILMFSEQGIAGFLLFIFFFSYLLIKGTSLSSKFSDPNCNNLAMATTLSLIMLLLHLFLNELIETDKIGSLYFICCALLIKLDFWDKNTPFQPIRQDM